VDADGHRRRSRRVKGDNVGLVTIISTMAHGAQDDLGLGQDNDDLSAIDFGR